jgi:hypothetical protein
MYSMNRLSDTSGRHVQAAAAPPSNAVSDGRTAGGRFGPGNRFSRGNSLARRMRELRSAVLQCVTPEDIKAVVRKLVDMATHGHTASCKILLLYACGRPRLLDEDEDEDEGDEA